uniref:Uncharacterized protein n=1 Tax=Geobacter metallireducens TaxID=28232 RepID=A0A831UBP4_GEOME
MNVIITESILIAGKHVEKGTVKALDAETARLLIGSNRAEEATVEALALLEQRRPGSAKAAGKGG